MIKVTRKRKMDPCSPSTSELKLDNALQDDQYVDRSFPPADTGKDAWLFLAAGFMVEALTWGKPSTFCCPRNAQETH